MAATATALAWANSDAASYAAAWEIVIRLPLTGLRMDLRHWVTDGLMVIFFLMIGLEVKHEIVVGHLAHVRMAMPPILAAIGGAAVPAILFLALTWGEAAAAGWGVPMTTDPAFAVGVLALVARQVPLAMRALLLTIATVDDLIGVLVIAFGYTHYQSVYWLIALFIAVVPPILLRWAAVNWVGAYLLALLPIWYTAVRAGVNPAISGAVIGLLVPARSLGGQPLLRRLLRTLAPVSAFLVVPVFALATMGVRFDASGLALAFGSKVTWAVIAGLLIGKFVGVLGVIVLTTKKGWLRLPAGVTRHHVVGLGLLAGIGYTTAVFIARAAYADPIQTEHATIGVLTASTIAALTSVLVLRRKRAPASRSPSPAE